MDNVTDSGGLAVTVTVELACRPSLEKTKQVRVYEYVDDNEFDEIIMIGVLFWNANNSTLFDGLYTPESPQSAPKFVIELILQIHAK